MLYLTGTHKVTVLSMRPGHMETSTLGHKQNKTSYLAESACTASILPIQFANKQLPLKSCISLLHDFSEVASLHWWHPNLLSWKLRWIWNSTARISPRQGGLSFVETVIVSVSSRDGRSKAKVKRVWFEVTCKSLPCLKSPLKAGFFEAGSLLLRKKNHLRIHPKRMEQCLCF